MRCAFCGRANAPPGWDWCGNNHRAEEFWKVWDPDIQNCYLLHSLRRYSWMRLVLKNLAIGGTVADSQKKPCGHGGKAFQLAHAAQREMVVAPTPVPRKMESWKMRVARAAPAGVAEKIRRSKRRLPNTTRGGECLGARGRARRFTTCCAKNSGTGFGDARPGEGGVSTWLQRFPCCG